MADRLEGARMLFRELIGGKCPGFIPAERGIKDATGKAEDWVPVGWVFECFAKVEEEIAALATPTPALSGDREDAS